MSIITTALNSSVGCGQHPRHVNLSAANLPGMPDGQMLIVDNSNYLNMHLLALTSDMIVINGPLNNVTKNILQLLKIAGAESVTMTDKKLQEIINRNLVTRDIFTCQQELIDAGYESIANL